MFSYIKEETVTQTFINVLRKFWFQQQTLLSPKPQKNKHACAPTWWDAPKNREVTWRRTAAGCEGHGRGPWKCHPAHAWHTAIWSSLWVLSQQCKAPGRYGSWRRKSLQWGDAKVQQQTEILLWYRRDVEQQGSWEVSFSRLIRHVWNSKSLNSKSLKEKKNFYFFKKPSIEHNASFWMLWWFGPCAAQQDLTGIRHVALINPGLWIPPLENSPGYFLPLW